ncbi:MAG TPA: hypothetical protein VMT52_00100 [Planctomycetota bacterium]|nr:hypothetical protein [Planctomycetota bacterium]
MSQQVYKFDPGQCICEIGDPYAGSTAVNVRKLSGTEAVLDPSELLHESQYVYLTLKFRDGPSIALSGIVVTSASGGIFIQWTHSKPKDGDRVDRCIREYLVGQGLLPQSDAAPAPAAGEAESLAAPSLPSSAAPPPASGHSTARTRKPSSRRASEKAEGSGKAQGSGKSQGGKEKRAAPASSSAPPRQRGARLKLRTTDPAAPSPAGGSRAASAPDEVVQLVLTGGKLDVGASIRQRAKVVSSSELASRVETVQIVNMGTIRDLIKEAVNEAVVFLGSTLGDVERRRLLEEAEAAFQERLEAFRSEKAGLVEKTKSLQEQLERAARLLVEERTKVVSANQFTVSDAGMVELEQRLGRLFDRALREGTVSAHLEQEMRGVVLALLDDERDKIREQAQQAQSDKIDLLERKVQRLASTLETAEKERDSAEKRAHALEASGGTSFRNVMTAGLNEGDPERERKLSLLKEIFESNQEIRKELVSAGRLPSRPAQSGLPAADGSALPIEAAGAAPPSSALEESRIAASLGIQRERPVKGGAGEASKPPAPAAEEAGTAASAAEEVPVLADGADPEDGLWEPSPEAPGGEAPPKVRRIGS